MSRKEEETDRKKEKDRLSLIERNVIALKNMLLNNKCTALPSSNSSTTFRHLTKTKKERTQAEKREWEPGINRQEEKKEKEPASRKRKKRKMESVLTSTPSFRTRQEQEETSRSPINVSPIKVFDLSRDVVDPEAYTSMEVSENEVVDSMKRTQMSDDLSKLLIEPKNERESQELLKILRQTLELTRAAVERGVIRMCMSDPDLRQPLLTNIFCGAYRRVKSFSLSEEMRDLNIDMWESDDLLENDPGWLTASTGRLLKSYGGLEIPDTQRKSRGGFFKNLTAQAISWKDEMKHFVLRNSSNIESISPGSLTFWQREREEQEKKSLMREEVEELQRFPDTGSPNLRKRKHADNIGLPTKIMTPEAPSRSNRRIVHMEMDEVEEVVGSNGGVTTPITERKKATPRRRIPSLGRKKKCEKRVDNSQRLISAIFFKNIAGVERLCEENENKDLERG